MTATLRRHDPPSVPAAVGGYTQGLEVGGAARWLFVSGQIPETPAGDVPESARSQCRLIWDHITSVLDSAGLGVADIVKVATYLSDRSLAEVNTAVRREVLGPHRPALTVTVTEIFDPRWLLEVEVVAAA